MDIHEYQAKELLSGFGVAVPPGAFVVGVTAYWLNKKGLLRV